MQGTSIHALSGNGTRDLSHDLATDIVIDLTATMIGTNRSYRTLLEAHLRSFTSLICCGRKYNSKS